LQLIYIELNVLIALKVGLR